MNEAQMYVHIGYLAETEFLLSRLIFARRDAPRASLDLESPNHPSISLKGSPDLLLRPVRIVAVCGAYDIEEDDWMITDFCWLHCLFTKHANVVEAISLSGIDETEATEKLHLLKMGHPSGPRLTIFQETDERFSEICNQAKLKSRFLEALRKVADRVTDAERLLVVVCAHGADSDDVQKAGNASKGDFLIGEDENGDPQLCSQSSLLESIPELKRKAVTLLTTSCFAGAWTNSQYTLVAGSRSKESLAFPASASGRARGGTFTAALTSTLADEWGQRLPRMGLKEDMLPSGQVSRLHLKTFEGHRKKIEEEIPVLLPYHYKPGFSLELGKQEKSQFEGIPTLARAIEFGKLVEPNPSEDGPTRMKMGSLASSVRYWERNNVIHERCSNIVLSKLIVKYKKGNASPEDRKKLKAMLAHRREVNSLANISAKLLDSKLTSVEDWSESSESAAGADQLFQKYSELWGVFANVPGGNLTRGAKYSKHRSYLYAAITSSGLEEKTAVLRICETLG